MERNPKTECSRKCKLAVILIGLLVLSASPKFAQTFVYRIDPAPVMTVSANVAVGGFPTAYVVPNATIKLCTNSTCTVAATAYTDATGNTACATSTPVTLPGTSVCTATAGPQGQFGFWVQPGTYYYTVTTVTGTFGPYPISSPTVGALGGPGVVSANATGGLVPMSSNLDCSLVTGASASLKITACANGLSGGGTLDTRNMPGAQTWNTNAFSGITAPFDLVCQGTTFTVSTNSTIPSNVNLIAGQGCLFSVSMGVTLTISGGLQAAFTQIFTGAGTVTFANNAKVDKISPRWFGATGDGSTLDTVAFQNAINAISQGTLKITAGTYLVGPINGKSQVNFECDPGYGRTVLAATGTGNIIAYNTAADTTVDRVNITGCTFRGTGASAIRASNVGAGSGYLSTFRIFNNNFERGLTEGVYGNLIFAQIEYNTYGLYGSASGAADRHIYSKGNAAAAESSNFNQLIGNRFYHATAAESTYFESGYMLIARANNWEQNDATGSNPVALRVLGMYGLDLIDNWFEQNLGSYSVWMDNDFTGLNGNYLVRAWNNWFDLSRMGNAAVFNLNGATTTLDLRWNGGVISNTQHFTCYAAGSCDTVGLKTSEYNRVTGTYTPPTFTTIDGTLNVGSTFTLGGVPSVLAMTLGMPTSNGIRLEDTGNSNGPTVHILNDGSHNGDIFWFNAAGTATAEINGSTSGTNYLAAMLQVPGLNYILTESGANNAIAGALAHVTLAAGTCVTVKLAHTLQVGANTFNFNAGGAVAIKSSRNVANNIGTAYAATGMIHLCYDGTEWVDTSQ